VPFPTGKWSWRGVDINYRSNHQQMSHHQPQQPSSNQQSAPPNNNNDPSSMSVLGNNSGEHRLSAQSKD
jgi:hypothetical protein